MASLKSLFSYLQNFAENEKHMPLLKRNVIEKIEFSTIKIDIQDQAKIVHHKILVSEEAVEEFLRFVADIDWEARCVLVTRKGKKCNQSPSRCVQSWILKNT